jgi:hypothetical protein
MWFRPLVVLNILSEELLPEGSKLIREFPWICPECGERSVSDLEDELPIKLRCRECSWPRRTFQDRPFVDGPKPAISPAAETTEFYFVASSEFCAVI